MYLAINYSPTSEKLIHSGAIDVDYFKTPEWEWMIAAAKNLRPVAIHFTLEVGNGALGQVDWEKVEQLAIVNDTPYINLHLDSKKDFFPGVALESVEAADREEVYRVALADILNVTRRFGPERVILENSPYRGTAGSTLRLCVEPDFIHQLIDETGCGLLLDIAHASLAAHYTGMNAHEYFNRLPVHQIKEMHFAGIRQIDGYLQDHLSITESDWQILDWVLSRIQFGDWSTPWLLAFEYGGVGEIFEWRTDPQVIREQVPMLYEKVARLNAKLAQVSNE